VRHRKTLGIFFLWCAALIAATSPLFTEGVDALRQGDSVTAERKFKEELKTHPDDAETFSFLGAALDSQKKFAEADAAHRRALALAPRSNSVLDKYGSHLAATGDESGARNMFARALVLDTADAYANLQLAQLALQARNGAEALTYLNRLSAAQQAMPDIAVRRVVALNLSGRHAEADTLAAAYRGDAAWCVAAGRALLDAGEPAQAEAILEVAGASNPSNLAVVYNLGIVTARAGHYARSRDVLESALRLAPRDADVFYGLAYTYDRLGQAREAFQALTQAARIEPGRADIQKSLASAAANLGEFKDAAAAWTAYVQLEPADDIGRRERGFANAHAGQVDTGIADLRWYIARHPGDADGYYELGIAESAKDPVDGLTNLDKAVALKPDFAAAYSVRGSLYYRQGKPEKALPDLERAAALQPDSAMVQYHLGEDYLALDRLNDALRVFHRAAEIAPNDYQAQFHLANALAEAGQTVESEAIMQRIRKWPVNSGQAATGLLDDDAPSTQ
jgi:tetratricopeptide (TPR) repeat protein